MLGIGTWNEDLHFFPSNIVNQVKWVERIIIKTQRFQGNKYVYFALTNVPKKRAPRSPKVMIILLQPMARRALAAVLASSIVETRHPVRISASVSFGMIKSEY